MEKHFYLKRQWWQILDSEQDVHLLENEKGKQLHLTNRNLTRAILFNKKDPTYSIVDWYDHFWTHQAELWIAKLEKWKQKEALTWSDQWKWITDGAFKYPWLMHQLHYSKYFKLNPYEDFDALKAKVDHKLKNYWRVNAPYKVLGPGRKFLYARRGAVIGFKYLKNHHYDGIEIPIFRNEKEVSGQLSSELILKAVEIFKVDYKKKYNEEATSFFTFVNYDKVSDNAGFCFKCAGFKHDGATKNNLAILRMAA